MRFVYEKYPERKKVAEDSKEEAAAELEEKVEVLTETKSEGNDTVVIEEKSKEEEITSDNIIDLNKM